MNSHSREAIKQSRAVDEYRLARCHSQRDLITIVVCRTGLRRYAFDGACPWINDQVLRDTLLQAKAPFDDGVTLSRRIRNNFNRYFWSSFEMTLGLLAADNHQIRANDCVITNYPIEIGIDFATTLELIKLITQHTRESGYNAFMMPERRWSHGDSHSVNEFPAPFPLVIVCDRISRYVPRGGTHNC